LNWREKQTRTDRALKSSPKREVRGKKSSQITEREKKTTTTTKKSDGFQSTGHHQSKE